MHCSIILVLLFFAKRGLWFQCVYCEKIETPAHRSEDTERYLTSKDWFEQDSMVDMPQIRRFIACKGVEEGLCQIKMNVSSYRCQNILEGNLSVFKPRTEGTSQKKKKRRVRKAKIKSTSKSFRSSDAANCTSGTCRCKPGLHYHAQKKLCFKACSKYGTDTIIYDGISIDGHNTVRLIGTSRQTCADACLKSKTFTCKTFDYGGLFDSCYLSTSTYYTVPLEERETVKGWVLGTRNCIG